MLTLKAVTKDNWEEVARLKPKPEQEPFMASNLYSIAEARYLESFVIKAIYDEEAMIGFTMFGLDPDDGNDWIYRFMIVGRFQQQGYGYHAMLLVIDEITKCGNRTEMIMLGYKPENEQARRFYAKLGFREEGLSPWGEIIAKYTVV